MSDADARGATAVLETVAAVSPGFDRASIQLDLRIPAGAQKLVLDRDCRLPMEYDPALSPADAHREIQVPGASLTGRRR